MWPQSVESAEPQRRPSRLAIPRLTIGMQAMVPVVSGPQTPWHSVAVPSGPSGSQGAPKLFLPQVPVTAAGAWDTGSLSSDSPGSVPEQAIGTKTADETSKNAPT